MSEVREVRSKAEELKKRVHRYDVEVVMKVDGNETTEIFNTKKWSELVMSKDSKKQQFDDYTAKLVRDYYIASCGAAECNRINNAGHGYYGYIVITKEVRDKLSKLINEIEPITVATASKGDEHFENYEMPVVSTTAYGNVLVKIDEFNLLMQTFNGIVFLLSDILSDKDINPRTLYLCNFEKQGIEYSAVVQIDEFKNYSAKAPEFISINCGGLIIKFKQFGAGLIDTVRLVDNAFVSLNDCIVNIISKMN